MDSSGAQSVFAVDVWSLPSIALAQTHIFRLGLQSLVQKSFYIAAGALILLIASIFTTFIYDLYFHPLARFPGPFLARLTNLYGAYHAWKGDLHIDMWRCHEKYGPQIRYGPNRLLFNSAQALEDIYGSAKQVQKSKAYLPMRHRVSNTFTEIDRKVHERKRRLISQGFSDSALRSYEKKILTCVDQLKDVVGTEVDEKTGWTAPKDMGLVAGNFAFDLMTSIIYGMSYDLQGSSEHQYIVPAIGGLNVRTGVLSQAPALAWRKIDQYLLKNAIICRKKFLRFAYKLMQDRVAATDISGDAFSILLNAKDPDTGLSLDLQQLNAESVNFLVAGFDTTATAIASLVFYLARYPAAYARVAAEVRSLFASIDEVRQGKALNSCKYLRACINEAMRMSPPVGSAPWREVKHGGHVIDGASIPSGVDVGTSIYSIHHNPLYFENSFEFMPERWLSQEVSAQSLALARSAFNPFSRGPRSCVGKSLALNEMMVTVASLLVRYDFRTAHGLGAQRGEGRKGARYGRHRVKEFQMEDFLTGTRNGPVVEFCLYKKTC